MSSPLVTVAVPSYNQGQFLRSALDSIFRQTVPIEIFVADGGSTDSSVDVIRSYSSRLSGWRSHPDDGQSSAINECIASGSAPYVCWLNSDDILLPEGLATLCGHLEANPSLPVAYGRVWNMRERDGKRNAVWVESFNERRLAIRCIVSQPGALIRRSSWEGVGGLDTSLKMAMDYDLWWRLFKAFGPFTMVDEFVAINRQHAATKTAQNRVQHYREAMAVVKKYSGGLPAKWWLAQPYAVWLKALARTFS